MEIKKNQKHCQFCFNNVDTVDYKNADILKKYLSSFARILPRDKTHTCSKHQRKVSQAIKRARFMALLPYLRQ